jgi:CDP-paratose 2-epimerase
VNIGSGIHRFANAYHEGQLSRSLVTGGAGFIGSNLVSRLITQGHEVTVLDNLSRTGSSANLDRLGNLWGTQSFKFIRGGVEDLGTVLKAADGADRIYHLAGQVAVTSSVDDPLKDFIENALGTMHLLEAARWVGNNPVFLYSSTNKIYGSMPAMNIVEETTRYKCPDLPFGVPETHPSDFHSPYGCSKGCGDQYTRDYHRIYGLRSVVFRQSCIYGPGQFGLEEQGWLCWLILAALWDVPITICGDGKQVRDVLYVEDLLNAYDAAVDNIDRCAGEIFNIGGGPANAVSIWTECRPIIERLIGRPVSASHAPWRPGDQKVYISDIRKAGRMLGWAPQITYGKGIEQLFEWIVNNESLLKNTVGALAAIEDAGPCSRPLPSCG